MENHLADAIIDAIEITRSDDASDFLVDVRMPDLSDRNQRNLQDIIRLKRWEDARRIAEHMASREGYRSDPRSFVYPDPQSPEPTPYTDFEGIYMFDGGDNPVHVNESAFNRLIARLLTALIDRAEHTHDAIMTIEWWPRFLNNVSLITKRAQ